MNVKRILSLALLITSLAMLNIFVVTQTANAYSNEALHWGFKRSTQENQPDAGARLNQLLAKHDAYYLGDTSKKDIYLTFDNGYENGFTPGILDTLKKKGVPAAFFVTGHYLKDQPELIKRMVDEGHIVGNHSWGHPDMTTISDQAVKEELAKVSQTYEALTGQKGMSYLRPPRGIFSERTLALSREMGYYNIFWSLAFIDWKVDEQKGWKYAYDNIMKQIHPGAILLLHSVSSDNAEALGKAIDDLQERGYHFRSLDRLLLDKQDVNSELIQ